MMDTDPDATDEKLLSAYTESELKQRFERLSHDLKVIMDKRDDYCADPEFEQTMERLSTIGNELETRWKHHGATEEEVRDRLLALKP